MSKVVGRGMGDREEAQRVEFWDSNSTLQSKDTFASLFSDEWIEFNDIAPAQIYPDGTELFGQESPAREVYIINRGLVKLMRLEQEGHGLIVGLRFPGWILGSASVITNKPHPVTAVTLTKCQLCRVPSETFLHLLSTDLRLSWHLLQMLSREVVEQSAHVAQLGCLTAPCRFEQLLWQLIMSLGLHQTHKTIRLQLPLKHREIAELIAVTPEHLSRILKKMQDKGIITQHKGWIVILDPDKIRQAAPAAISYRPFEGH
jgi:CRP-like cAMP-binding protein